MKCFLHSDGTDDDTVLLLTPPDTFVQSSVVDDALLGMNGCNAEDIVRCFEHVEECVAMTVFKQMGASNMLELSDDGLRFGIIDVEVEVGDDAVDVASLIDALA